MPDYQVVWDGTRNVTGRYLSLEFEDTDPKAAPLLPRQHAQVNQLAAILAWFAGGRVATMREVVAALGEGTGHNTRRYVYLLEQRGHLRVVQMRESRPGVVERVYGATA